MSTNASRDGPLRTTACQNILLVHLSFFLPFSLSSFLSFSLSFLFFFLFLFSFLSFFFSFFLSFSLFSFLLSFFLSFFLSFSVSFFLSFFLSLFLSYLLTFLVWPIIPNLCRCRGLVLHLVILRHTTLCRTPPNEGSTRRRDLYLTTHNTDKRQASMSPTGFEPAIPTS